MQPFGIKDDNILKCKVPMAFVLFNYVVLIWKQLSLFILFNYVVFIWKQLSLFLLWNCCCGQQWRCDSSEWDWGESMDAVNKSSIDYSESSVCKPLHGRLDSALVGRLFLDCLPGHSKERWLWGKSSSRFQVST